MSEDRNPYDDTPPDPPEKPTEARLEGVCAVCLKGDNVLVLYPDGTAVGAGAQDAAMVRGALVVILKKFHEQLRERVTGPLIARPGGIRVN